jgi:hypothetical protein
MHFVYGFRLWTLDAGQLLCIYFSGPAMTKNPQKKRAAKKLANKKHRAKVSDSAFQAASIHAGEICDERKADELAVLVTPLQKHTSQSRLDKSKLSATYQSSTKRMQLLRSRLSDTKRQTVTEQVRFSQILMYF